MNIFIFILLIILLVLSAILISYSSYNLNKITYIKKGGGSISANQLYDKLNTDANVAITIFKLNNGKINMAIDDFHIRDAKISALIYGKGEALIGNMDIMLHILLNIDDNLKIIFIGDIIAFKLNSNKDKLLLSLLKKHLSHPIKEMESKDGVHIITFKQNLEFDPIEVSISVLIKKITGSSSNDNSIYKLMDIFRAQDTKIRAQDTKIAGGGKLYTIELNHTFLSKFEDEIKNQYNSIIGDNIEANTPSLYSRFMYSLIENNRNVEIISEIPHTEQMKKGTIYFIPKRGSNVDISVFSKLGINNYTNIPLGEYYINNSQNVIKIE
jgi:hypothetical protein